jgi:hypothetical protein
MHQDLSCIVKLDTNLLRNAEIELFICRASVIKKKGFKIGTKWQLQ